MRLNFIAYSSQIKWPLKVTAPVQTSGTVCEFYNMSDAVSLVQVFVVAAF